MSRRENQKLKLYRLLQILFDRTDDAHGITMAEIISALDEYGIKAERKSIYDDFLTLDMLGFTVEKLPTRPTSYYLCDRIFELAELKLLVDAVESSRFVTAEQSKRMIEKLKSFAGSHGARELSRQVIVEGRAKTMNSSAIYNIDEIHRAINENRQIKFKYYSYDSEKRRVLRHDGEFYRVSPISLVWSSENYYLVGYDEESGSIRNYRVDKMQSVSAIAEARSAESVELRGEFADYTMKIFGMYGGEEVTVTLECDETLANSVVDRFGADVTFIKSLGGFRVSVRVIVSPMFFAWVMGFGSKMRIVSPTSVRDEFIRELRATLGNYESTDN